MGMDHNGGPNSVDGNWGEENRRVLGWVAELLQGPSRETALMELSKKREQVPELALIIWHSFGKSYHGCCLEISLTWNPRRHDLSTSGNHLGLPSS